jgi:hypothetical protein
MMAWDQKNFLSKIAGQIENAELDIRSTIYSGISYAG